MPSFSAGAAGRALMTGCYERCLQNDNAVPFLRYIVISFCSEGAVRVKQNPLRKLQLTLILSKASLT